ncbi:FAD-binding oxidoreductase [Nordella sp. HKS 07]|uniref:FAD-binding oxidoreductase n=1 Tax=Nordella sp. HKS 07 TaxID=2712222 RepID=UPI0013E1ECE7|nr:FAD-binding oxidoreductase [Nordella sp. HKS 07]QIG50127.1 FAD-binding oxidoreductase [Nordella sp. HKS 07]
MDIRALRLAIRGTVVTRDDAHYETLRAGLLWNGRKPDRFPEIVVKVKDAADVQAAVRFAAANGKRISVRGGGHHWSGIALQEGVVLDLADMNALSIDPEARIARAQPTVTNGRLAAALAEYGLAFPAGHCASVPLSGYLLGGGFGWNTGAWGIACHNVESVDVVLANGSLITASASENADIFWAARGAGPAFFGVVTEYRLRLYSLPKAIRTSVWTYRPDRVEEVEEWMSRTMRRVPRNVEFTAVMSSAPPPLAGRSEKVLTAVATIFAETEEEAGETLAIIETGAPEDPLDIKLALETPFDVLYRIIGQFFPEGARFVADTNWSDDPAMLMKRMAEAVAIAPSPESFALAVVLPPFSPDIMPDGAFSRVGPAFSCAYAIWRDPGADAENVAWLRNTSDRLAPVSLGHYVGEADLERPERAHGSFSPAACERLKGLRRKFDPACLFHHPGLATQPLLKAG